MNTTYHEGELEVQRRAGVREMADRVCRGVGDAMPRSVRAFVGAQPWLIVASRDERGQPWARALFGNPGFAHALDARTLRVHAGSAADHLFPNRRESVTRLGTLAIDLATRQRVRINGQAEPGAAGSFLLRTRQVFALCPKYIQARVWEDTDSHTAEAPPPERGTDLSPGQQHWIARADTFFIATAHPRAGPDAAHRGGAPGFVRVEGASRLVFPDYAGNSMFNTLGNLAVDARAGLLFLEFEQGHTLHLSGRAHVDWSTRQAAAFPGAERLVVFDVEAVMTQVQAFSPRARFLGPSPYNPWPPGEPSGRAG